MPFILSVIIIWFEVFFEHVDKIAQEWSTAEYAYIGIN